MLLKQQLSGVTYRKEKKGGIEKSVPRITFWYLEACRVMTNGDHEGHIFLSHPHTNNGLVFLLTIKYHIFILKRLPEVSEYAKKPHIKMTSL